MAFERAGCRCIWSCDWDVDAQNVYQENFGERPFGDIKQIPSSDIPNHDILVAGFPCPSFSIIGDRKGLNDHNGSLFFQIERILKDKRPRAFLLENVRDLKNHDHGRTLKIILDHLNGIPYYVHWKVLNALDFGLLQKRERIIIVGFQDNLKFEFPEGFRNLKTLKDILEDDREVPEKYRASEHIQNNRAKSVQGKHVFYPSIWHENKGGDISVHTYSCALRANASYNYLLVNGVRRPTPKEMLRLQGFPEDFKLLDSDSAIRKLMGNTVPIPMIQAVAKNMLQSLKHAETTPIVRQAKLLEAS